MRRGWLIWAIGVGGALGVLAWLSADLALGVVATGLTLALLLGGWWWERAWLRPIYRLTQDLEQPRQNPAAPRLLSGGSAPLTRLASAVNQFRETYEGQMAQLATELQRSQSVLRNMADGAIIADGLGVVMSINPAACQLLNLSKEAALGRSVAEVVRHHDIIELWQRCREQQLEQTGAVEVRARKLFLQVIVTPLVGRESPGYLLILQDLTQVRRLQTIRQDFISNISHELRTPLASLRAVIETLQDGALDDDPPAAQRFLDRAEAEVDTLTQMVEELLELSRIESGQVPLRLSPVAVKDIIWPVVERLQPQAERAGLHVMVDIPADLPLVLVDAARVQQVVSNLLHNAVKFTLSGGSINLSASVTPHYPDAVLIEVADTGIGIPVRDLPRIFERFYKSDRARARGGTGLGLAIAKHLVQAHGGEIWAKSREGKGSHFFFTLPRVDVEEGIRPKPTTA